MKTKNSGPIVPSWVVSQALASPESMYTWGMGVCPVMTRRAKTMFDRMVRAGIPATLERDNRFAPGLWKLSFPVNRYREAAIISDACKIGDPSQRKYGAQRARLARAEVSA